jgi:hypothetical protein
MAGLAFAFRGPAPDRLHFAWPVAAGVRARLRNPRYVWVPPAVEPRGVLRNPRYRSPAVPFPGEIPPQNVRAGSTRLPWGVAVGQAAPIRIPWGQTAPAARGASPTWTDAEHQTTALRAPWRDVTTASRSPATTWRDGELLAQATRVEYGRAAVARSASGDGWRAAVVQARGIAGVWFRARVAARARALPWREAQAFVIERGSPCGSAVLLAREWRDPWRDARILGGLSWPWPVLPPLPPVPPRAALRFHFHAPTFTPLRFHFGRAPAWVIPIQRSYRMQHVFDLVRLPDRVSIPVSAVTLSSAWDEWSWSLSATLAGPGAVELLRPVVAQAVEVEVQLNGTVWQFRLDQVSGSAQFGQTGGQTQGRGRAALLGPDVALPVNGYENEDKTARQLAEQELIGTDWQLDWPLDFPDWLVPAGRFSYSQKTPVEVIVQIVETAGGRVLADPALSWLRVAPKYPVTAWAWATTEPDLVLPRAILKTLAWKPRNGKPWDAAYLGDGQAVLAKVKRTGLPGVSLPDSPIIEPLLCHLDACRARGIAVLSDAAAGVDFTLALPLSSASGPSPLRAVGELVRFDDGGKTWAGLITGVSVAVGFGTVTQTLDVRAVEVTP